MFFFSLLKFFESFILMMDFKRGGMNFSNPGGTDGPEIEEEED